MSSLYDLTSKNSWINAKRIRIEYSDAAIIIHADSNMFVLKDIKNIYNIQKELEDSLSKCENESNHGLYRGVLDLFLSAKNKYMLKREFKCTGNLI